MALPSFLNGHDLLKFRTKPCERWINTGSCCFGDRCQYSHEKEWHRRLLWQAKYSPRLCRSVLLGSTGQPISDFCPLGKVCPFSHSRTEQLYHPAIYKKLLCRFYAQDGFCSRFYCPFAHGSQELSPVPLSSDLSDVKHTLQTCALSELALPLYATSEPQATSSNLSNSQPVSPEPRKLQHQQPKAPSGVGRRRNARSFSSGARRVNVPASTVTQAIANFHKLSSRNEGVPPSNRRQRLSETSSHPQELCTSVIWPPLVSKPSSLSLLRVLQQSSYQRADLVTLRDWDIMEGSEGQAGIKTYMTNTRQALLSPALCVRNHLSTRLQLRRFIDCLADLEPLCLSATIPLRAVRIEPALLKNDDGLRLLFHITEFSLLENLLLHGQDDELSDLTAATVAEIVRNALCSSPLVVTWAPEKLAMWWNVQHMLSNTATASLDAVIALVRRQWTEQSARMAAMWSLATAFCHYVMGSSHPFADRPELDCTDADKVNCVLENTFNNRSPMLNNLVCRAPALGNTLREMLHIFPANRISFGVLQSRVLLASPTQVLRSLGQIIGCDISSSELAPLCEEIGLHACQALQHPDCTDWAEQITKTFSLRGTLQGSECAARQIIKALGADLKTDFVGAFVRFCQSFTDSSDLRLWLSLTEAVMMHLGHLLHFKKDFATEGTETSPSARVSDAVATAPSGNGGKMDEILPSLAEAETCDSGDTRLWSMCCSSFFDPESPLAVYPNTEADCESGQLEMSPGLVRILELD